MVLAVNFILEINVEMFPVAIYPCVFWKRRYPIKIKATLRDKNYLYAIYCLLSQRITFQAYKVEFIDPSFKKK